MGASSTLFQRAANGPDGSPEFAQMHYSRLSAANLGRLLDAGLIPPPAPSTAQDPSAVEHTPTVSGVVQRYGKGRFVWWQDVCEDTSMISALSLSTAPVEGVLTITPTSIMFERRDGADTMIPFSEIKSVAVGSGFVRYGMIFVQATNDSCNSFVASPFNLIRATRPVALFLASEGSRYLTGNTLFVDGGSHINGSAWAPNLDD